LAEEAKPSLPPAARGLHYLLSTSFRYVKASRVRRAHVRPGIFYAAETVATAMAESTYWRLLLLSQSPGAELPRGTIEHSAYAAAGRPRARPDRAAAHRANVALLDPGSFADAAPNVVATYHMRIDRWGLDMLAALPSTERHLFAFADLGLRPPV
jgi:hypothetical protein